MIKGRLLRDGRPEKISLGLDSEGRLIDTKEADKLVAALTGKTGKVVEYKQEPKKNITLKPILLAV